MKSAEHNQMKEDAHRMAESRMQKQNKSIPPYF